MIFPCHHAIFPILRPLTFSARDQDGRVSAYRTRLPPLQLSSLSSEEGFANPEKNIEITVAFLRKVRDMSSHETQRRKIVNIFSWIGYSVFGLIVTVFGIALVVQLVIWLVRPGHRLVTVPIVLVLWLGGRPVENFIEGIRTTKDDLQFAWGAFGKSLVWSFVITAVPFFLLGITTMSNSPLRSVLKASSSVLGGLVGYAIVAQTIYAIFRSRQEKTPSYVWYWLPNKWGIDWFDKK